MNLKLADGSTWPNPLSDVEWRLRYSPDRGTELCAASVCAAYRELVGLPALKRNEKIRMIREALNQPSKAQTDEGSARR